jgi:hypothetical protein
LPNICGAIGGTHIPLAKRQNKRYIIAMLDYYNQKKFHSIIVQVIGDAENIFVMFVLDNLEMFTMGSIQIIQGIEDSSFKPQFAHQFVIKMGLHK